MQIVLGRGSRHQRKTMVKLLPDKLQMRRAASNKVRFALRQPLSMTGFLGSQESACSDMLKKISTEVLQLRQIRQL